MHASAPFTPPLSQERLKRESTERMLREAAEKAAREAEEKLRAQQVSPYLYLSLRPWEVPHQYLSSFYPIQ